MLFPRYCFVRPEIRLECAVPADNCWLMFIHLSASQQASLAKLAMQKQLIENLHSTLLTTLHHWACW